MFDAEVAGLDAAHNLAVIKVVVPAELLQPLPVRQTRHFGIQCPSVSLAWSTPLSKDIAAVPFFLSFRPQAIPSINLLGSLCLL